MSTLNVTGNANAVVFSGKQNDSLFTGESLVSPFICKRVSSAINRMTVGSAAKYHRQPAVLVGLLS